MLSIILKRVQNARNYLSNERLCMKLGRFFADILKSKYQEIFFAIESILKFTLFSKSKTERNFHREVQNVAGPESQASLTCGTDAKWLYPTNLDANLSTLTGLCFGVLSPTATQFLYSQFANLFTLKPKPIKLARYV